MYPVLTSNATNRRAPVEAAFRQARTEREALLKHFGFHQLPFAVTPDPGFLFRSGMHRAALEAIIHSIESNLGFTVLLGDPGTGKTTLLFQLLTQYRDCARTAFIFQTQCKPHDLLRYIASELELPGSKRDEVSLHQRLKAMLVEEARAGRRVLIVVDEAQNLHHSSLEAIRLLSDFETASAKLLHVVLAGSSRLGETLLAPELSPLAQRVFTVCRLGSLTPEEVKCYVNFRLGAAGSGVIEDLFSPDSLAEIAKQSDGVPRVINSICYRSLSLAYSTGQRHVSRALVQQAVRDLDLSESRSMNLRMGSPSQKTAKEDGCRGLPNTSSGDQNIVPQPYNTPLEIPRIESARQAESQTPSAGVVANGFDEQWQSPGRGREAFSQSQEQHKVAASAGLRRPSPKRIRVLRPVGFGRAKFSDSYSSIVVGTLLLLALGAWSAWHELRPKSGTSAEYRATSIPPKVVPSENKDGESRTSPDSSANLPVMREEPNQEKSDYKPIGTTGRRAGAAVIQALPDGLLRSRIIRPSSSPSDPTVPNHLADTPGSSDPLIQPLANVPPSVPQLNGPVAPSEPTTVAPAHFLHPTKVVQPEYPKAARLRHIEGDVVLELEIDARGTVEKVRTVSGNAILREAAEQAARQWHYPPVTGNEIALPAVTQVRFNFRLDPDARK